MNLSIARDGLINGIEIQLTMGEEMKRLLGVALAVGLLTSCTIKTADYTINQGIPSACVPQVAGQYGASPGQSGAGSTNSGGAGNTVIIIEDSKQDSNADSALGAYGGTAATGMIKDALSKWMNDMRQTDSNNPATTTTTTTTTPTAPVFPDTSPAVPTEEIAEPVEPEGQIEEVD